MPELWEPKTCPQQGIQTAFSRRRGPRRDPTSREVSPVRFGDTISPTKPRCPPWGSGTAHLETGAYWSRGRGQLLARCTSASSVTTIPRRRGGAMERPRRSPCSSRPSPTRRTTHVTPDHEWLTVGQSGRRKTVWGATRLSRPRERFWSASCHQPVEPPLARYAFQLVLSGVLAAEA